MIHIRANRDWNFIEVHIKGAPSITFPGYQYVSTKKLDNLIAVLLEVQSFMKDEPERPTRKWEVS